MALAFGTAGVVAVRERVVDLGEGRSAHDRPGPMTSDQSVYLGAGGVVALIMFDDRPSVEHDELAVGGGHLQLDAGALVTALPCREGVLVGVVGLDLSLPGSAELIGNPRVAALSGAKAGQSLSVLCLCRLVAAVITRPVGDGRQCRRLLPARLLGSCHRGEVPCATDIPDTPGVYR